MHPTTQYVEIGIRSFGRGIFHKEPVMGSDLGSKRVFWIEPGDLVFNNVFAWEGAVARAGGNESGKIGSHRFMTYLVDSQVADPTYLRYFFLSERGLSILGTASPGSAGRNRTLAIDRFANARVDLPEMKHQIEIAARLDRAMGMIRSARDLVRLRSSLRSALVDTMLDHAVGMAGSRWPMRRIDDVAEVNPAPTRLDPQSEVSFVPMAAVDDKTGTITSPETRLADDVRSGYKQFRRNDVVFARITPCMQNGKSAVAASLDTDFAYGTSEFHVIRAGADVLPEWLHRVVRTRAFRTTAAERFTGTAGQQRVPADYLREATIPVPPALSEQRAVVHDVDRISEVSHEMLRLEGCQLRMLAALEQSLLNAVFGSREA